MLSTNTRRRRLLATAAAAVVGLLCVVVGATPAHAASGSGYIYRAPGASFGYYQYNNVNSSLTTMRILSNPAAMSSGYCYDMWLDHTSTTGGHYDGRVARSCRSSTQRDSGSTNESGALNGLNKLGVCYGPNNATNSPLSNCLMSVGSMSAVSTSLPNPCARSWIMSAGGTPSYYNGGNVYSCTS